MSQATMPALVRTPPLTTSLRQLPDALRSLWRAACPETAGGDVARALTINFVGIAPAAGEFQLREVTNRLLRRSPCRAFLLFVDDSVREVRAEVSAMTRCSGALRDIVLEEIAIRLPSNWFGHLPGLLRPLLMNDLPNHLFWSGGWPSDARRFDSLGQLCEHTVVDTRHFQLPAVELDHLQTRRQQNHRITDLSWLRLRPWRRALAEAFQHIAWTPSGGLSGTIRHGRSATSASILLAQWLEKRLGARLGLEEASLGDSPCPDLVVLRTPQYEVQVQAQTKAQGTQLTVHISTTDHCHLPFHVPSSRGSDGDLLAAAIDMV